MAKERPLDSTLVRMWIATWKGKDLYSNAAVHHLHSLISDNDCMVVITFGVGRAPRSLDFCCRRFVEDASEDKIQISKRKVVECDINRIFVGPVAPAAPEDGQLWRQTGMSATVLQWEGTRWVRYGYFRKVTTIVHQGEQECSFMEALASAHRFAQLNGLEVIYTFDDSTWGTA